MGVKRARPGLAPAAIALLSLACRASDARLTPGDGGDAGDGAGRAATLTGSVSTRYRGRRGGGREDHDLLEILALDWSAPRPGAGSGEREPLSATLLARGRADLDGEGASDDPFVSLADTRGGELSGDVFRAELVVPLPGAIERARLGRVQEAATPELAWFDGVLVEGRERGPHRLALSAYAGRPVHLYEPSAPGEWLAGLALDGAPWAGARARLDWMHLEDERVLAEHHDDLVGASLVQVLDERWTVSGDASLLEGEARDARLGVTYAGDDGLFLRLAHLEQLETQRETSLEADPFFDSLRALFPYRATTVLAARDVGRVGIEVGGDWRRVDDDDDVGAFNREYDRGYLSLTLRDTLPADIVPSLTAERWHGDGSEVEGLGFDLARELGEGEDLALGTYRSLYKVDLFAASEHVDVRTWFVRWRRRARSARGDERARAGLDCAYEYEDGEGETFHALRLGVTWRF